MRDIALPRDVIARVEGRWARRVQQEAQAWLKKPTTKSGEQAVVRDGQRTIPVIIKRSHRPSET